MSILRPLGLGAETVERVADYLVGKSSEDDFEKLKGKYSSSGIGLFLGLGVSCGSGLPSWETLTQRVMASIEGGQRTFDMLRTAGYSLPAILSWASARAPDFKQRLRAVLYCDLEKCFRSGIHGADLRDEVRRTNPTLAAVAAFLGAVEDDGTIAANSRVAAVLTTNADTLLRYYTRKTFDSDFVRTVERASAGRIAGKTNIYHLHGMLRFDDQQILSKEAPDQLIFTDLEYYAAYRDPTSIFAYTPLFLFREFSFLFVGTRLTDDNIRRLLSWSQCEIANAYKAEQKPMRQSKQIRHFALLLSGESNEDVASLLEPLGVAPLWYRKHEFLPRILRELYADPEGWGRLFGEAEQLHGSREKSTDNA